MCVSPDLSLISPLLIFVELLEVMIEDSSSSTTTTTVSSSTPKSSAAQIPWSSSSSWNIEQELLTFDDEFEATESDKLDFGGKCLLLWL